MRDRENGFYSEAHSPTHFLFFGICRATTACGGLVSSVCQASHSQAGLAPTEPCTGCSRFLPTSECERDGNSWVANSARLIRNETHLPCRALVACVVYGTATASVVLLLRVFWCCV